MDGDVSVCVRVQARANVWRAPHTYTKKFVDVVLDINEVQTRVQDLVADIAHILEDQTEASLVLGTDNIIKLDYIGTTAEILKNLDLALQLNMHNRLEHLRVRYSLVCAVYLNSTMATVNSVETREDERVLALSDLLRGHVMIGLANHKYFAI